jgi:hypothetical protein
VRAFSKDPRGSYSYPTALGSSSRLFMQFRPWANFRGIDVPAGMGTHPVIFTLQPNGDIQYWPKPTAAFTVVHEYYRNPQDMSTYAVPDADSVNNYPRMPDWSHMAIAWKAVMIGCGKTGALARMESAEEMYEPIFQRMHRECRPQIGMGGALA